MAFRDTENRTYSGLTRNFVGRSNGNEISNSKNHTQGHEGYCCRVQTMCHVLIIRKLKKGRIPKNVVLTSVFSRYSLSLQSTNFIKKPHSDFGGKYLASHSALFRSSHFI